MDILDTLHQEHERVKKLLKQMLATEESSARSALFAEFRTAMVKHSRAEEKAFYEKLSRCDGIRAIIEAKEGYVEHFLADTLIHQLKRVRNKSTTGWTARANVLKELVEHHIHEEEAAFFSTARDTFSPAERAQMNDNFEAFKKKVKA
jgi:hemerythrin-like domain-containing protein